MIQFRVVEDEYFNMYLKVVNSEPLSEWSNKDLWEAPENWGAASGLSPYIQIISIEKLQ